MCSYVWEKDAESSIASLGVLDPSMEEIYALKSNCNSMREHDHLDFGLPMRRLPSSVVKAYERRSSLAISSIRELNKEIQREDEKTETK